MLILFLQTFTWQRQVTSSTARILQILLSAGAIASWANYLRSKESILSRSSHAFLTVIHKTIPNTQKYYQK